MYRSIKRNFLIAGIYEMTQIYGAKALAKVPSESSKKDMIFA